MNISRYYSILGVDEDASEQEIRRRYRSLAKKLHPDHNTSHNAQEQFIMINEAYEGILEYRKNEKEYRPTKRKEQSKEDRLKEARKRYYEQLRREEMENDLFFSQLTSGKRWTFVKSIAIIGLILSALLLADYFLPYRYESDRVSSYNFGTDNPNAVQQSSIFTENGHHLYLKEINYSLYLAYPEIYIERSRILHEATAVLSIQKTKLGRYDIGFGLYNFRPIFLFFFLLPCYLLVFRHKKILFTLIWYLTFYASSVAIVVFLLTGNHFIHLISFGFF